MHKTKIDPHIPAILKKYCSDLYNYSNKVEINENKMRVVILETKEDILQTCPAAISK